MPAWRVAFSRLLAGLTTSPNLVWCFGAGARAKTPASIFCFLPHRFSTGSRTGFVLSRPSISTSSHTDFPLWPMYRQRAAEQRRLDEEEAARKRAVSLEHNPHPVAAAIRAGVECWCRAVFRFDAKSKYHAIPSSRHPSVSDEGVSDCLRCTLGTRTTGAENSPPSRPYSMVLLGLLWGLSHVAALMHKFHHAIPSFRHPSVSDEGVSDCLPGVR